MITLTETENVLQPFLTVSGTVTVSNGERLKTPELSSRNAVAL